MRCDTLVVARRRGHHVHPSSVPITLCAAIDSCVGRIADIYTCAPDRRFSMPIHHQPFLEMNFIVCHALLLHIACPSVWAWIRPPASPSEDAGIEIYIPGEIEIAQPDDRRVVSDAAKLEVAMVVLSLLSNELMLSEDNEDKPQGPSSHAQQRTLETVLYLTYANQNLQANCRPLGTGSNHE